MKKSFEKKPLVYGQKKLDSDKKNNNLFFILLSWAWYYLLVMPILFLYVKLMMGLTIKGRKNRRKVKKTGYISVSNHVHKMDGPFNAFALFPKKVIFTSIASNFKVPIVGWILKFSGVESIGENISDLKHFMENMKIYLKKKKTVHFYAEGHLMEYYAGIRPLKRGAFVIACDTQVPILPIVIGWRPRRGIYRLFYSSKPCPIITIGEPLKPDDTLPKMERVRKLQEDTEAAMHQLYRQINHGNPYDYYKEKEICPMEHRFKTERG